VGKHRISPILFPITPEAIRINTAYVRAGMNRTGEINNPSMSESVVAITVKGGAK
jgi:hypothetical protein